MSQVKRDLQIVLPYITVELSKIPFDLEENFKYLKVDNVVEDCIKECNIESYEELREACVNYIDIKYNTKNSLYSFLK